MGVRAAEAEGTHSGSRRLASIRPGLELTRDAQRKFVEPNMWIWLPEMQSRRNLFMLEGERNLNQAGDACGGFQMSNVAFDRTNKTVLPGRAAGREDGSERLRFNQVAQRGSRPV